MSQKGQQKIWDEFAWIIFEAVGFVLIVTIIFSISTPAPVVEPKSASLTLAKGDSHTFTITVKSEDGKKISNVTLTSFGEMASWVTFDKNKFDIDNSTTVRVKIQVPTTAVLRNYAGGIKVEAKGGSSSLSLSITVGNVSSVPLESRPIFLGSFEVRYAKGSETVDSKSDIQVAKSTFSKSEKAYSISIPAEKLSVTTSAHLDISVVDTNKRGNLIVEFNGLELYNQKSDVGKVVIPIDKALLNTTNTVKIRTTGPSVFQFWSKAVYSIEKSDLVTDFQDVAERSKTFELKQDEIQSFRHFQLQSRVKEYSAPLEELFIEINDQIVYASQPPLAAINQTITKDILGNNLALSDQNRISFFFEKEAFLNLDNVFLVVFFS